MFIILSIFLLLTTNALELRAESCTEPFEEYTDCGSRCFESCEWTPATSCLAVCEVGCFCISGYKRDANGRCVLEAECPPKECKNYFESWSDCGNRCFESCTWTQDTLCPTVCDVGCFCDAGFKRDRHNKCVPADMCSNVVKNCGPNEKWTENGNRCVEDCSLIPRECAPIFETGCFCKSGYKRHNKTGRCVKEKNCFAKRNNNNIIITMVDN
uniref:CSON008129 protein n=1 Tax=Culicoides sonorensis TaxID=179676 RepID=A0A336LED8_CULSO